MRLKPTKIIINKRGIMNWKNISIEPGFVKQEINLNGSKAVNYIPMNKIDSFGVVSTENKLWLYIGCFMAFCGLVMGLTQSMSSAVIPMMVAVAFIGVYFYTRQTHFTITSNQKKFSVKVITSAEEMMAVDMLIMRIKECIHEEDNHMTASKAA